MAIEGEMSEIKIDLNKITKREMSAWRQGRRELRDREDGVEPDELDKFDFEHLYVKVITAWPYGEEITFDAYLDLPYGQAVAVDQAVGDAITDLVEKKSET